MGGGFQHVALSCADALASARTLRAKGASLLSIPDNYYDDLDARFAFDAETLGEMAACGVLYDEDAAGQAYRQFYSRAFDKLFFFEFVERRSGYAGYGAPNAGVRLAAQSRYREPETVAE
ncbi:hypothetical protein MTR62_17150 [Novosphingobium sp. 1949]|uniref:4-hydroxyphenylpyruvate dioxygenase n=1 Tax=Novosphingobium organovorum TaxID=2930092 RepID=A0ABT0BH97_9SPHN|nr:hypothetical protein [Novosphingobium organovorum]MCJ2184404.1 hypothetical protein [Novosphingobium organovorum]